MKSSMGVVPQTLLWYFWNRIILGIIWWMWKFCSDDGPRESETWKSWINIYQFKTSIHPSQDKLNVEKWNVFTKCVYCKVYVDNTNTKKTQIKAYQRYRSNIDMKSSMGKCIPALYFSVAWMLKYVWSLFQRTLGHPFHLIKIHLSI